MNRTYFGDAVAVENLVNNSICVKVGKEIRNIRGEEDLDKELLVFVSNADTALRKTKLILKGETVRYVIARTTVL